MTKKIESQFTPLGDGAGSFSISPHHQRKAVKRTGEGVAIGIDPGFSGAIAVVTRTRVLSLLDLSLALPPAETQWVGQGSPVPLRGTTTKKRLINGSYLSPEIIYEFLKPFTSRGASPVRPDILVIEDVSAMTGAESASSSFKFGQTKGLLTGLMYGLFPHTPIRFFKPAVWKASLGLTSDKAHSLAYAKYTWKAQEDLFRRVKDDGRAEACLLGLCGISLLVARRIEGDNILQEETPE